MSKAIARILDQLNPPEAKFNFSLLYRQLYNETRHIEPGESLQLIHQWIREYLAKLSHKFQVETSLELLEQVLIVLERCSHLCLRIITHLNLSTSEFWIRIYSILIEQFLYPHKSTMQKHLQLQYWKYLETKTWHETSLSKLITIFVIIHLRSHQPVVSWFVEEPLCVVVNQMAKEEGLVVTGASSIEHWNLHVELVERNLKFELRPRLRHLLHLETYPELERNLVSVDSQWLPAYEQQVTWIVENLSRTFINRALVSRHAELFHDASLCIARKPLICKPTRAIQEPTLKLLQRYFTLVEANQELIQQFTILLGMICEEFRKYTMEVVENRIESVSLVSAASDPKMNLESQASAMVKIELLGQLQQNLALVLRVTLYSNPVACQIVKQVMSRLVNSSTLFATGSTAFARALAVYIHQELNVPVPRVDNVTNLKLCIPLIRYIEAKDIFERNLRAFLARRLLGTLLPKLDWERYLVYNLTLLYDSLFANQLDGMIQDVTSHGSIQRLFTQHLVSIRPNFEVKVHLLTQHYWSKVTSCTDCLEKLKSHLPEEVLQISDLVSKFYLSHLSPKKLWICLRLSWALVVLNGRTAYFSACQLVILYNLKQGRTVEQIRQLLSPVWTGREVNYALKLLLHHKILAACELGDKNCLEWSEEWQSPCTGSKVGEPISVNVTTWRELQGTEMLASHSSIQDMCHEPKKKPSEDDHQMAIDATIVRVIKQKQKMTSSELIKQVTETLASRYRRQVRSEEVKKRIVHLVQMEYIELESKESIKNEMVKLEPGSTLVYMF